MSFSRSGASCLRGARRTTARTGSGRRSPSHTSCSAPSTPRSRQDPRRVHSSVREAWLAQAAWLESVAVSCNVVPLRSIVNSTFNANIASQGGAISSAGRTDIVQSTIVGNVATSSSSAGVDRNGGTLTVRYSIIGNNLRLAMGTFLLGYPGHPIDAVARARGDTDTDDQVGDIIIEDDVWLGSRSTVLGGVRIGRGTIVAAGSVVTKDLPPFVLAGGIPAVIKKQLPRPADDASAANDHAPPVSKPTLHSTDDAA